MHIKRSHGIVTTTVLTASIALCLGCSTGADTVVISAPGAERLVEFQVINAPLPPPDDQECRHFVARSEAEWLDRVPRARGQQSPVDFARSMVIAVSGTCIRACPDFSAMRVDRVVERADGWRVEATWFSGRHTDGDCIRIDMAYVAVPQSDVVVTFDVARVAGPAP